MKVACIIPSRYASTRLPAKALIDICGKTMVQRVYEQAKKAKKADIVVVATDDDRIYKTVREFGGEVIMTSTTHPTGTDRLAEVAAGMPDVDVFINVQGDEPLIAPELIDAVGQLLIEDESADIATAKILMPQADYQDASKVKVVTDVNGYALYFSRAALPFMRNQPDNLKVYKHIGIYAYRRDFLLRFSQLKPAMIECAEALEQLRALFYGYRIKVVETEHECLGVDTAEDVAAVAKMIDSMKVL